ncbi:DNA primase [Methylophilus medardicus]|uniref:DNA primase n=1 Tax=Methylophilus medardicus TaxID=2588534 RepID=A0A5B8CUT2_9PROT|nr:DNA primase [Methylophilus medardicus]QDC45009.1 DNA primase [Methylophilus medardicus]QDC50016.1 DNA primase [Methylophilus medardicus]QDC53721.1 DNA primase [Methylophilus medardicus]
MIPESFIQELLNRVDIVEVIDKSVPLKKAGTNYSACCPFHNEKSPSFTVSPTKQFYHCFGCGAHGSALSFLMEYNGLSFVEAIHDLARQIGMIVPQEQRDPNLPPATSKAVLLSLQETLQQAANYYKAELKKSPRAIEYLKARGLSGQVAAKFQVGYAPAGWQNLQSVFPQYEAEALETAGLVVQNEQGRRYDRFRDRIMFPIHNQKGEVIGFGGRVINPEDSPKYYNSPETPVFQKGHELYGLFMARRAIRDAGRVLVVEGYMDVVALAQYGIEYAVAALGTATTPFHIAKLMRQTDEIVFSFDGDKAGRTAAWRAVMNALPAIKDGLKLRFLFLPAEHDPDSFVREFGKEAFEAEMEKAMPLSQYIIQHLSEQNPLASQEDKVQFLNDAEPILKQIQAPRYAMLLRKKVAEMTGLAGGEVQRMLKLPDPAKIKQKVVRQRSRTPSSLFVRLALMLLMRPQWAKPELGAAIVDESDEAHMLRIVIRAALAKPESRPVVLLQMIAPYISEALQQQLQRELSLLDESLDFTLEFEGACTQLSDMALMAREKSLLGRLTEKPFSTLSDAEREALRQLTSKR